MELGLIIDAWSLTEKHLDKPYENLKASSQMISPKKETKQVTEISWKAKLIPNIDGGAILILTDICS